MAASHTPGPWRVSTTPSGDRVIGIGKRTGEGIADCGFGTWRVGGEEALANARLIAAAPDLLAAVKSALAFIEADNLACEAGTCIGEITTLDLHTGEPRKIDLSALRAAIAKAEGRADAR